MCRARRQHNGLGIEPSIPQSDSLIPGGPSAPIAMSHPFGTPPRTSHHDFFRDDLSRNALPRSRGDRALTQATEILHGMGEMVITFCSRKSSRKRMIVVENELVVPAFSLSSEVTIFPAKGTRGFFLRLSTFDLEADFTFACSARNLRARTTSQRKLTVSTKKLTVSTNFLRSSFKTSQKLLAAANYSPQNFSYSHTPIFLLL